MNIDLPQITLAPEVFNKIRPYILAIKGHD